MRQNVMDAVLLEALERRIADDPHDEDLRRCYALAHGAINFDSLSMEKQEALLAEIAEAIEPEV